MQVPVTLGMKWKYTVNGKPVCLKALFTHTYTHTHTFTQLFKAQFILANSPIIMILGNRRKPDNLGETHTDVKTTWDLSPHHPSLDSK